MYVFIGPEELAYKNARGVVVGCKSACLARLSLDSGIQPFNPFTVYTSPTD